MTYDEKVEIVVQALIEARQFTRKDHFTKLHFGTGNGLDRIPSVQVKDILDQLQDDERVIEIKDVPVKLKSPVAQASAMMGEVVDYFLIDILDSFGRWYSARLLKKKQQLPTLTYVNLAKIYDVMLDIEQALQIEGTTTVTIPTMSQIVRFTVLFPGDSIGSRRLYQQYRMEGVKYLEDRGIVSNTRYIEHDFGMDEVRLTIDVAKFDSFYREIETEHKHRLDKNKSDDKQQSIEVKNNVLSSENEWPDNFRWIDNDFVFGEYGKVSFTKNSASRKLFEVLTNKRGEWASIGAMRSATDNKMKENDIRTILWQKKSRFSKELAEHIDIVSTRDDDDKDKPSQGAYKIRFVDKSQ